MRRLVPRALASLLVVASFAACAAGYPTRPIRLLTGAAPGTVIDVVARQFADKLGPILGQPLIVESKPSAGGIIALEALARSPPDGYTLALVHMGQMSVAPSLFRRLPYDTVNDFTHVGIVFRGPQVLVAPTVGARSLGELVDRARLREMRYASPGAGTPTHIFMEQFQRAAGIRVQHVPYRGAASLLAVLNGEVDMFLEGAAIVASQIRAGKLRALAVTGSRRLGILPEVPTFEEEGIAGMETVWVGVVGPRGVSPAVVQRINESFRRLTEMADIRASFEEAGRYFTAGSPEEMRETVVKEVPRWRTFVEASGMSPY